MAKKMNCFVNREIKLKSGRSILAGEMVSVLVKSDTQASIETKEGWRFSVHMHKLYQYFEEFCQPTMADIENALCDHLCYSVLGYGPIDPDGHDQLGFPSILLACGYC